MDCEIRECPILSGVPLFWIDSPPEWPEIGQPAFLPEAELLRIRISRGERDAILLAQEKAAGDIVRATVTPARVPGTKSGLSS
jgi:hypothetical protein